MATLDSISKSSLSGYLNSTADKFKMGEDAARKHISANKGFVAFSGGKDSMVSLHLSLKTNPDIPVCFYDSGLEFPENLEYIQSIAKLYSLNFHIIKSDPTVLDILKKEAFFDHKRLPVHLQTSLIEAKIENPSKEAHERFGPGRIWGLRAEESRGRRMLLVPKRGTFTSKAGEVVTSPVWNWSTDQIFAYLEQNGIPQNPLYEKLRHLGVEEKGLRVGSVIDGSNLDYGRITWLKRGWPEMYDKLRIALPRIDEFR
jgi:phosphoadenosine phosphosulfate reductase